MLKVCSFIRFYVVMFTVTSRTASSDHTRGSQQRH